PSQVPLVAHTFFSLQMSFPFCACPAHAYSPTLQQGWPSEATAPVPEPPQMPLSTRRTEPASAAASWPDPPSATCWGELASLVTRSYLSSMPRTVEQPRAAKQSEVARERVVTMRRSPRDPNRKDQPRHGRRVSKPCGSEQGSAT